MTAISTSWWSRNASPRTAYAVAAVLGLVVVLAVHGPAFVFGTSAYWDMPWFDHRTYLMGYRYFLHEPWHWPLFDAHTINVPYGQSIAFNDALPLWALINKAIATVIPPWRDYSAHAYLGLWYALATMLQGVLGVANLRALGHRSWASAILGALVLVSLPAWTFRFFHASLYAHFLVLWALYLYLVPPTRRVRAWQLVELAVASLLNPYHTVMSLGVFAASLARSKQWRVAAGWFAAGCAVVLAGLALAGYFAPQAATAMPGFAINSSNLLAFVMPHASGWFGTAAWVDPTDGQFEGTAYLGLGLLVLLAVLARNWRSVPPLVRRHAPLAIVAGGAVLVALSNRVYLGSHRVLGYPLPTALHWIQDQFRAPGRFIWLPMYVLVLFALSRGLALRQRFVLPLLVIVQLVDVSGEWRAARQITAHPERTAVDRAAWEHLLAQSDAIAIYPADACNSDHDFFPTTQIEFLASDLALPIDGVSSSRAVRDCAADTAMLASFTPQPRTLYVFVAPLHGLARKLATGGLPCAQFNFGDVCDTDRALIDSLHWPATPAPTPLAFGTAIDLSDSETTYTELGWSWTQRDGRWTDGPIARVVFRTTGPPPPSPVLHVEGYTTACDDPTVDVFVGGVPRGELHIDHHRADLPIARDAFAPGVIEIELRRRDHCAVHVHRISIM